MEKAILLSVVISMAAIPVFAAREVSALRALKKTIMLVGLFNAFYLIAIRFVFPLLH